MKFEMSEEGANIESILCNSLEQGDTQLALTTFSDYSWFLLPAVPRTDINVKAIGLSEKLNHTELLTNCLLVKANIYAQLFREDAIPDLNRAKELYVL